MSACFQDGESDNESDNDDLSTVTITFACTLVTTALITLIITSLYIASIGMKRLKWIMIRKTHLHIMACTKVKLQ